MKNQRLILSIAVLIVAGAVVAFGAGNHNSASPCGNYKTDKNVRIGSHNIAAEVADNSATRDTGLGGRPCIGQNQGMLFVFSSSGQYSFWMKDMKFPIDMIWISSAHKAVVVQEDVLPSTYPDSFVNPANEPAQYVLELKAHASTAFNINPGTPINF